MPKVSQTDPFSQDISTFLNSDIFQFYQVLKLYIKFVHQFKFKVVQLEFLNFTYNSLLPSNKMILQNSADNLSIELEENFQGKSNQQILQQFQQITRRIAESDRNNIIYRQMKKQKHNQLNQLNNKHTILKHQHSDLQSEYNKINNDLIEAKAMIKKNQDYFQMMNKNYEIKFEQEKQIQAKTNNLSQENEKLQKRLASLQNQYDQIIKSNKQKSLKLQKLKKLKQQKNKQLQLNQQKIQKLQKACQSSKSQAQKIQRQVKKQKQYFQQLKIILQEKENQLKIRQKEREQAKFKQQQATKQIQKMMAKAKSIQQDIDKKYEQMRNLQRVHSQYQSQISNLQQSQKRFEELLMKRRQLLTNVKKCDNRIVKQKQANDEVNNLKNNHQE